MLYFYFVLNKKSSPSVDYLLLDACCGLTFVFVHSLANCGQPSSATSAKYVNYEDHQILIGQRDFVHYMLHRSWLVGWIVDTSPAPLVSIEY